MNYRYQILQILPDGDKIVPYKFQPYDWACKTNNAPNPKDYLEMYDSCVEAETPTEALNKLFVMFNTEHPSDFYGHSLSVSDVVMLNDECYYCDSFGWAKLPHQFWAGYVNPTLLHHMARMEAEEKHNAPFAAAKICNESCTRSLSCQRHKNNASQPCPLEVYIGQRIAAKGTQPVLTRKDTNSLCVNCVNTQLTLEQGQPVLEFLNSKGCANCPVREFRKT